VSLSLDKLDGKTSEEFYQEHLDQRRAEQENISERIKVHQNANVDYCEKGLSILELANKAYCLYLQQTAEENANSSISCF
jgi:protein tyrosine/serine phosphatase